MRPSRKSRGSDGSRSIQPGASFTRRTSCSPQWASFCAGGSRPSGSAQAVTESLFRMIERGEQFGMMVGALGESVPIRIVALEPSTILRLDYEEALELTLARPDLRRLWLKTYAGSLRKDFLRRRTQAVGDDAGTDSRFTRHATGGRTAHPATVRRR